jgi:hypothetical protein
MPIDSLKNVVKVLCIGPIIVFFEFKPQLFTSFLEEIHQFFDFK